MVFQNYGKVRSFAKRDSHDSHRQSQTDGQWHSALPGGEPGGGRREGAAGAAGRGAGRIRPGGVPGRFLRRILLQRRPRRRGANVGGRPIRGQLPGRQPLPMRPLALPLPQGLAPHGPD